MKFGILKENECISPHLYVQFSSDMMGMIGCGDYILPNFDDDQTTINKNIISSRLYMCRAPM